MSCPYDGSAYDCPLTLIYALREKPWDTITIHYDAGEWAVTLSEDAGRQVEGPPRKHLLEAVKAALKG